jgi:protein SCO1/2
LTAARDGYSVAVIRTSRVRVTFAESRRKPLPRLAAVAGRAVVGLALIVTTACGANAEADARRVPIAGVVAKIDRAAGQIDLAHDAIEGVMPAMTMTVRVSGPTSGIVPGDRITGTLVISADASAIEDVRLLAHADGPVVTLPAPIAPAAPGTAIPAVSLVNQDGARVNFRQFAGVPLVVTFIYTRCPLPEYCPRTMRQLEELRRALAEAPASSNGRVHLVGVTLDPAHDNPPALRAYAKAFVARPTAGSEWTLATGTLPDIQRLAAFFGVSFGPGSAGLIHSRVSGVVTADGRLQRVFSGDDWGAADILAELRPPAGRANP